MKETIDRLSKGIIEYERPALELSVERIELSIDAEDEYSGDFIIRSGNGILIKSVIYSTNELLRINTPQFSGVEGRIGYVVNTHDIAPDTIIEGEINIVSNGGEQSVDYCIKVVAKSADTSIGKITNMFHFANFVQTDYEEALRLFVSEQFKNIFLRKDIRLLALYEGLLEDANPSVAMEEFLIATNKKKRISISLSDVEKKYNKLSVPYGDSIVISKDNWGYVYISVSTTADFIKLEKTVVTGSDFAGSNYELSFILRPEKMHAGINSGRIIVVSGMQELECEITVENSDKDIYGSIECLKSRLKICRYYLNFRTHNLSMDEWANKSAVELERFRGINDTNYMAKLMLAQIYIVLRREADASWLLESVAETLLEKKNEYVDEYCYYLYVRSLQKKNSELTIEMKNKVTECYENGYNSWIIMWILLYMDENFNNNPSLKLARIKEHFNAGMKSPIMYFEAAAVMCEQPALLRVLNPFELQVINFAVKYGFITEKLTEQFAWLALSERNVAKVMFNTLTVLYKHTKNEKILSSICSILIKNGATAHRYFEWYKEGIEHELKLAGIYESYLYSADESIVDDIPQVVLMYFMYNTDMTNDKLEFLYSYVISKKDSNKTMYNAYLKQMEKYAAESMRKGRIDKYLAIIYNDLMSKSFVTPEMASKLPGILCTWMIKINNSQIKSVRAIHKELCTSEVEPVVLNTAYVRIYAEDAILIYEDVYGRKYISDVKYSMDRLIDMDDYLKMCYEISAQDIGLCTKLTDEYVNYRKEPEKAIGIMKMLLVMDEVRPEYKQIIEREVIDYYYDNNEVESLDDYLQTANVDSMNPSLRVKVMELMIIRGLYELAYDMLAKHGYSNMEPRRLIKLIAKRIIETDFAKDEFLLEMASYVFRKGKYNEIILEYLNRFYYGTTKEMIGIWEAGIDFNFESRELEERLIGQMLFSGTYLGSVGKVYDSYYAKGAMDKVSKAYLISKSYDYFIREKIVDDNVFAYIEKEINNKNDMQDICYLAYLKYFSEEEHLTDIQIKISEELINKLCSRNITFEFYKKFKRYFKLPYVLEDKTVIEYRTRSDSKVYLNYILETGTYEHKNYAVCEMRNVYPGIFTFDIVLFTGESLVYYITENRGKEDIVTSSECLKAEDREIGQSNTKYGLLNDILICQDLHEDSTMAELGKSYLVQNMLVDEIFTLM